MAMNIPMKMTVNMNMNMSMMITMVKVVLLILICQTVLLKVAMMEEKVTVTFFERITLLGIEIPLSIHHHHHMFNILITIINNTNQE